MPTPHYSYARLAPADDDALVSFQALSRFALPLPTRYFFMKELSNAAHNSMMSNGRVDWGTTYDALSLHGKAAANKVLCLPRTEPTPARLRLTLYSLHVVNRYWRRNAESLVAFGATKATTRVDRFLSPIAKCLAQILSTVSDTLPTGWDAAYEKAFFVNFISNKAAARWAIPVAAHDWKTMFTRFIP